MYIYPGSYSFSSADSKPAVVVTHGDLLTITDRARVRVHVGELLGVHPAKHIFDIPGNFKTFALILKYNLESDHETSYRELWPRSGVIYIGHVALYT